MLSRRSFQRRMGLAAAACLLPAKGGYAEVQPPATAWSPRLSVMLWTLKQGRSFAQRLEVVAAAGYRNIELVDEFREWAEADWQASLAALERLGLTVDATAGMKTGFATIGGGDAFLSELQALIPIARRLHCPQIILLSGKLQGSAHPGEQHAESIATLRRAAEVLAKANLVGVIEPIDRLEQPEIYLDGVAEAFQITRAVGSPNVKVLYDLYHEQRSQGNLIEKLEKNIDQVGLIHVADVPGRHEPGTGEINYRTVYRSLERLHYAGVLAMEFYPTGDAVATLREARRSAGKIGD